jgi:DNA-binding GntR family transcriptional regulator
MHGHDGAVTQRPKLSDEIAVRLRDQIISGVRRPGERLVLDDLAGELGVSRMPVRDAVLALSLEGLTEVRSRRGVVVAPITRADVADAYEVMAFISGLLAARAAQVLSDADLAALEQLHQEMVKLDSASGDVEGVPAGDADAARLGQLNWEFHRIVNRASSSRKLLWLFRSLTRNVPQRFYQLIPGWLALANQHHSSLLVALLARDELRAGTVAESHIRTGGTMLVDYLARAGFWGPERTS